MDPELYGVLHGLAIVIVGNVLGYAAYRLYRNITDKQN